MKRQLLLFQQSVAVDPTDKKLPLRDFQPLPHLSLSNVCRCLVQTYTVNTPDIYMPPPVNDRSSFLLDITAMCLTFQG